MRAMRLRLGERLHPELDAIFIAQPDRSVALPTRREIDWLCSWAEPTTPRITLGN
jgi:hypothetical protein